MGGLVEDAIYSETMVVAGGRMTGAWSPLGLLALTQAWEDGGEALRTLESMLEAWWAAVAHTGSATKQEPLSYGSGTHTGSGMRSRSGTISWAARRSSPGFRWTGGGTGL
ncbi:hypothetical protein EDC27_0107 [Desulfosoma caldarium]|uniref:Uncharacterized protein n=1 Tax=Desulfosoma caldarium TaxID=610254 RepID=A0A3N1VQU3_9BACT|nr:hypothetical protein EDC27_0107 [Desulfosoma caldarium]